MQQFRTAYIDLARRNSQKESGSTKQTPEEEEPDFELSLFSSALVDYNYIMRLLAKYAAAQPAAVKITKAQLLDILAGSVDLMNEREYLKAFIEEELSQGSGMSELEIRRRYKEFKNERFNQKIAVIAQQFNIDKAALEHFVSETAKLLRLDEDALRELLNHIDNWKQRKTAKENLIKELHPLLTLLSGGNTFEGLNAYVK